MTEKDRPRLKDIAERTGFSINTVSVALRGGDKVPEATRNIILEAARELNYLPNAFARSLASKTSRTVGVILSNLLNPILTLTAQLIERQLEARGYRMTLLATDGDLDRERRAIDSMREHQVEGILIYPSHQGVVGHIVSLRQSGFPILLLSGNSGRDVDLVSIDDRIGTYRLTTHLLELGHRRIGLIDVGQAFGNFRKLDGYRDAHAAFGLRHDRQLVFCPAGRNSADCGYRAAARMAAIAPELTALLCSSDPLAIGAMGRCRDNGVRVPTDLSIAGFDDIEFAAYLDVPLTTVGYSAWGISEQSVARLMVLMQAEGGLPEPETVLIEPELIVRRSTQPPRSARQGLQAQESAIHIVSRPPAAEGPGRA